MAGFVLRDSVEELTYDFKPHAGSGTIPEPSSLQIMSFQHGLAELFGELVPPETSQDATVTALAKAVTDYLGRDMTEIQDKLLHVVSAVCSDHPSFDDLNALPFRAQQAFIGWVVGTFLVPSLSMPGITR
jgi:hypothetical protein